MAFTLEVEFSGLCLYVVDAANERVGVLMPDAREEAGNADHPDGIPGEAHVGYLRFDLSDLNTSFPSTPGDPQHPLHEGIIQFSGHTLEFVITGEAEAIVAAEIRVPHLEEIAPPAGNPAVSPIKLRDGLFTDSAPGQVLMRTLLTGGTIRGNAVGSRIFNNLFRPGMPAYQGDFAPSVKWSRPVESVTIRLHPFAGGDPIEFPLTPSVGQGSTLHLRVANLCNTNPLAWRNLGAGGALKDDVDFKWLYLLLAPITNEDWRVALQKHRFPIPLLPPDRDEGVENCIGLQVQGSTA